MWLPVVLLLLPHSNFVTLSFVNDFGKGKQTQIETLDLWVY